MAELKYWVWLSSVAGMGPGNVRRLLERFESPDQVFFAQREEFEALGWLSAGAINALCAKKLYQAVEIIDRCAAHGWQILTVRDAAYPERLRNIYDPPVVLYVRGGLPYLTGGRRRRGGYTELYALWPESGGAYGL
jgi:DNA processing protein